MSSGLRENQKMHGKFLPAEACSTPEKPVKSDENAKRPQIPQSPARFDISGTGNMASFKSPMSSHSAVTTPRQGIQRISSPSSSSRLAAIQKLSFRFAGQQVTPSLMTPTREEGRNFNAEPGLRTPRSCKRGPYRCSRCGQMLKGHQCPYKDASPKVRSPLTTRTARNSTAGSENDESETEADQPARTRVKEIDFEESGHMAACQLLEISKKTQTHSPSPRQDFLESVLRRIALEYSIPDEDLLRIFDEQSHKAKQRPGPVSHFTFSVVRNLLANNLVGFADSSGVTKTARNVSFAGNSLVFESTETSTPGLSGHDTSDTSSLSDSGQAEQHKASEGSSSAARAVTTEANTPQKIESTAPPEHARKSKSRKSITAMSKLWDASHTLVHDLHRGWVAPVPPPGDTGTADVA